MLSDVIYGNLSFCQCQRKPVRTNQSIYWYEILLLNPFINDYITNWMTVLTILRQDWNSNSFTFSCSKHNILSIYNTLYKWNHIQEYFWGTYVSISNTDSVALAELVTLILWCQAGLWPGDPSHRDALNIFCTYFKVKFTCWLVECIRGNPCTFQIFWGECQLGLPLTPQLLW